MHQGWLVCRPAMAGALCTAHQGKQAYAQLPTCPVPTHVDINVCEFPPPCRIIRSIAPANLKPYVQQAGDLIWSFAGPAINWVYDTSFWAFDTLDYWVRALSAVLAWFSCRWLSA